VADSATHCRPRGGFRHAATKIAVVAPIAGKENHGETQIFKIYEQNQIFLLKNKYAPCRVEMCEQCNEIIKRASKSRKSIPLLYYKEKKFLCA
jgi:hypothetical protein